MKLRLVLDVNYAANGVPFVVLRDNLAWMIQTAMGEGTITGSTAAEVISHDYRILERQPAHLDDVLVGPGEGYCVMNESEEGEATVSVVTCDGRPVVFSSEYSAEKCIAEFMRERYQQIIDGELGLDDLTASCEHVVFVTVFDDGTIIDALDRQLYPLSPPAVETPNDG